MENQNSDDELLMLSGIQHMAFCERQWALIHIEQIWTENIRTIEGQHFHERTDDPFADEKRKTVRIIRSMPLISHNLGLRGVADVIEFHLSKKYVRNETCQLKGRDGWWRPVPIEYKRGRPKSDDRDNVQLCAQAIALEEMLHVVIPAGYIFYGETRRRETVVLDVELRQYTMELAMRMQQFVREGKTPKAKKGKRCSQCSLVDYCQPYWMIRHRSVDKYLKSMCRLEVNDP